MTEANFSAIRARLRFSSLADFIEGYAPYISSGGIFIPMAPNKLKPIGTTVRFQFLLQDGSTALLGEGIVRQIHGPEEARPERPVGMLVKFSRLSQDSKQVVDQIVSFKDNRSSQMAIEADSSLDDLLGSRPGEQGSPLRGTRPGEEHTGPMTQPAPPAPPPAQPAVASALASPQPAPVPIPPPPPGDNALAALLGEESSPQAPNGFSPEPPEPPPPGDSFGDLFGDDDDDEPQPGGGPLLSNPPEPPDDDPLSIDDLFEDDHDPAPGQAPVESLHFGAGPADSDDVPSEPDLPAFSQPEPVTSELDEAQLGQEEAHEPAATPSEAEVPQPRTLARTEGGLQIMAFDEIDDGQLSELSDFDFVSAEDEIDDMFGSIFGGSDASEVDPFEVPGSGLVRPPLGRHRDQEDNEAQQPAVTAAPHEPEHDDLAALFDIDVPLAEAQDDPAAAPSADEELAALLAQPAPVADEDSEPAFELGIEVPPAPATPSAADIDLASLLGVDEPLEPQQPLVPPPPPGAPAAETAQEEDRGLDLLFQQPEPPDTAAGEDFFSIPESAAPSAPDDDEFAALLDDVDDAPPEEIVNIGGVVQLDTSDVSEAEVLVDEDEEDVAVASEDDGPAPSAELLSVLGVLDDNEADIAAASPNELMARLTGQMPSVERAPQDEEADSLASLMAMAEKDIAIKQAEERRKNASLLEELLGDDEPPPPPPQSGPTFAPPDPETTATEKKKKGGLFGRFFGNND